ncbi:Uncharacterised protein [Streptococcus pseudoporcinus]|uniref:Uncharacterized protein n=1 Tax=Streptococcus pseudoporcinus TaxID=361101 RepID=A0A4U9XQC0_9STRE|nr:hypothetical protein [Streptococcus pseudoporcinus]VTS15008.1 Uncharacterised protein [Streptococcus pseudoporcinus]
MATEKLSGQQKADKKWAEKNREHRNYLSKRSTARSFINNNATKEDLIELKQLIDIRFYYSNEDIIRYSKAEYPFGADKYIWIAGDGELLATVENIRPKSKDSNTVIKVGKVIGNTLDRTK